LSNRLATAPAVTGSGCVVPQILTTARDWDFYRLRSAVLAPARDFSPVILVPLGKRFPGLQSGLRGENQKLRNKKGVVGNLRLPLRKA